MPAAGILIAAIRRANTSRSKRKRIITREFAAYTFGAMESADLAIIAPH